MEKLVDTFFDEFDGEEFCHVFVPKKNEYKVRNSKKTDKIDNKRQKKLEKFDKMIPGQFNFHYSTQKLGDHMFIIKPDTIVTVTVKLHGTSAIFSNILCKKPLKLPLYLRVFNKVVDAVPFLKPLRVTDTYEDYDFVYSSRSVIKNQYINPKAADGGFYKTDVWEDYYKLLNGKIPEDMTIYGEIFGYQPASHDKMIQKGYDYGCDPGTNKLMIYRITTNIGDGKKFEWEVDEVREWTLHFMKENPDIADRLHPIDILYHGTLKKLYPDVDTEKHWTENVLLALKNDKEHFGMELNEPLCKNKVPREGIVIRIDHDPVVQAFKLKTDAYALKEAKDMDAGVVDIEM